MAEDAQEVAVAEQTKPSTPRSAAKAPKRVRSKTTKKAAAAQKAAVTKPTKAKVPRPFPKVTLEDALVVAQKIKELNGGNPWATAEVAKAVEMGARSPNFYYLTAASRDFGLTTGTRETPKIELTDLGRQIVYAPNAEAEHEKR